MLRHTKVKVQRVALKPPFCFPWQTAAGISTSGFALQLESTTGSCFNNLDIRGFTQ